MNNKRKIFWRRRGKRGLKKELLKECCEKINEFLKTNDNVEGIRFLEENGGHFTLKREWRSALYLCSDGSFKEQGWGMYMGDHNIQKRKINWLDVDDLKQILRLSLKELLIEQILELRKPKSHKIDKLTQDTLNEIFG